MLPTSPTGNPFPPGSPGNPSKPIPSEVLEALATHPQLQLSQERITLCTEQSGSVGRHVQRITAALKAAQDEQRSTPAIAVEADPTYCPRCGCQSPGDCNTHSTPADKTQCPYSPDALDGETE